MQTPALTPEDPEAFWEDFYRTKRTTSSGRPSSVLVALAADLEPGTALDLGASHGDDVFWLAARGWEALGVDISEVAMGRARARAAELGLSDRARFERRDLAAGLPEAVFDLVTAFFLQSPVDLPRAEVLRAAAGCVAPGGHLLVVAHAAPPPWAPAEAKRGEFPTVESELDAIGAAPGDWQVKVAEVRARAGTGPEGETAELLDTVVLLRRLLPCPDGALG